MCRQRGGSDHPRKKVSGNSGAVVIPATPGYAATISVSQYYNTLRPGRDSPAPDLNNYNYNQRRRQ